jgi:predicted nucleic acid-binding protein
MKAYVDTSVVLRIALGEAEPLPEWRSLEMACSSELLQVEGLRSLDRARILLHLADEELAERREAVLAIIKGLHIARLDARVLSRAADPFPTSIRTLDAIHLATALLARTTHEDLAFATHDGRLGTAARAVGFDVIGIAH